MSKKNNIDLCVEKISSYRQSLIESMSSLNVKSKDFLKKKVDVISQLTIEVNNLKNDEKKIAQKEAKINLLNDQITLLTDEIEKDKKNLFDKSDEFTKRVNKITSSPTSKKQKK